MDERIPVLDLQNQQLKKQIADLESELVGARLDAKYLDKVGLDLCYEQLIFLVHTEKIAIYFVFDLK